MLNVGCHSIIHSYALVNVGVSCSWVNVAVLVLPRVYTVLALTSTRFRARRTELIAAPVVIPL